MGSGGTLVEGVRRWFQRRTNNYRNSNGSGTNTAIYNNQHANNIVLDDSCGHVSSVSELRAQSSVVRKRKKGLKQGEEREEEEATVGDFDTSCLKLIKVPKRTTNSKPGSMDSQKKVSFFFQFFSFSLFFEIWVFWISNG